MLNKVLIVDDSEIILKLYRKMLRKYKGCAVVVAKTGKEALKKLSSEKNIELILLDINMPEMSGIEFLQHIKNTGKHSHIPTIVIGSEGSEEKTLKALELGAYAYMIKPFEAEDLYTLIKQIKEKTGKL